MYRNEKEISPSECTRTKQNHVLGNIAVYKQYTFKESVE